MQGGGSSEEPEPPTPPGKARRSKGKSKSGSPDKGKGKGKAEAEVAVWPPIQEILARPKTVREELLMRFLMALGCDDHTPMDVFEALSAKDIADAIDSEQVKENRSIMERALLFKLCKDVATLWGANLRPHPG